MSKSWKNCQQISGRDEEIKPLCRRRQNTSTSLEAENSNSDVIAWGFGRKCLLKKENRMSIYVLISGVIRSLYEFHYSARRIMLTRAIASCSWNSSWLPWTGFLPSASFLWSSASIAFSDNIHRSLFPRIVIQYLAERELIRIDTISRSAVGNLASLHDTFVLAFLRPPS